MKSIEKRLSDTAAYRYTVGVLYLLGMQLARLGRAAYRHLDGIIIGLIFIAALAVYTCFDVGEMSFRVTMLLLAILALGLVSMLKSKK